MTDYYCNINTRLKLYLFWLYYVKEVGIILLIVYCYCLQWLKLRGLSDVFPRSRLKNSLKSSFLSIHGFRQRNG